MVHPGRRRLNPLEPSLPNDAVPIDRDLGVAAVKIGVKELLGHALLAGVDNLIFRRRSTDLFDVTGLNRVTEN
jgi:hypothetical protein